MTIIFQLNEKGFTLITSIKPSPHKTKLLIPKPKAPPGNPRIFNTTVVKRIVISVECPTMRTLVLTFHRPDKIAKLNPAIILKIRKISLNERSTPDRIYFFQKSA